ncbi:MAG: Fic family protein [Saprospiraceae bacterium]
MKPLKIFISSVQKEFAKERKALASYFRDEDPDFNIDEGFKVILWRPSAVVSTAHDQAFLELVDLKERLIWMIEKEMSRDEIMNKLELQHRQHFQKNYIEPALQERLVEMTLPDTPTSKNQKYSLAKKGVALQKKLKP